MKSLYACLLMPLVAFAGTPDDGPPEHYPPQEPPSWERVLVNQDVGVETTAVNTTIVKTEVGAQAEADADALATVGDTTAIAKGGEGGQGGQGGQGGAGGASTVGDTTATVGNVTGGSVSVVNEGDKIPRQVASAYAPAVFPTAICEGGQSLGVQTTKFGVSWTRSDSRREACLFALAQQWMAMGAYGLACQALMATRSATYAHTDKEVCHSLTGPAPLVHTPAQSQPTVIVVPVTNGDPERIERIFKQLSEK